MKTKTYLSLVICYFIATTLFGQRKEFKFGKIDNSDLTNNTCLLDANAEAYILGDFGTSSFEYTSGKGFQTVYKRHFRIKVLKQSAVNWARVEIPLYAPDPQKGKEIISDLKGNTYNIESGKKIVSKLDTKTILEEKVNRDWVNKKFTMPEVKEGSVIEVSYSIISDFYDLRPWRFQYNIPVLYSQYETQVPEYFKYKLFQYGLDTVKKESSIEPSAIEVSWTNRREFSMVSNEIIQTYHFKTYVTRYIGENINSFRPEPYMSSPKDYISSLEFVLTSLKVPHSTEKNYESSWESITTNLLGYNDFGAIVNDKDATKEIIKASIPQNDPKAIFNYIRNNFKWNGNDSVYASKSIKRTIEEKTGNSADINLLLINALKNAGFKADPVVLSTRGNGKISMANPVQHKLNYVIALVKIDNQQYWLDATDKLAPFGLIPEKCLNGQGRIINDEKPENIDLISAQHYKKNVSAAVKVNINGELSGTWNEVLDGYAAYNFRKEVLAGNGIDKYVADKQKITPGLTIQHCKFENLDSLDKNVIIGYDFSLKGFTEQKGNLLTVHPLLCEQMYTNPFAKEERKYPVDYVYPYLITCKLEFDIPEGYQVESLPKFQLSELPGKSITYIFSADNEGNKVKATKSFTIQKPVVEPGKYKELRELYNQMVSKESDVVVLKKL